jgi:hypothetical protein
MVLASGSKAKVAGALFFEGGEIDVDGVAVLEAGDGPEPRLVARAGFKK